jgi:1,4-dihydroxy-2-naphthoyl-CoA hydrolase
MEFWTSGASFLAGLTLLADNWQPVSAQLQEPFMDRLEFANSQRPPFTKLLGVVFTHISDDRVEATMFVRDDMSNPHGICHGGALMSFADTTGAIATVANMPRGSRTTTMESKTNFLRGGPTGETLRAVCTPVHKGRRTQVWRTDILRENGKLVATVTQTQMVIAAEG